MNSYELDLVHFNSNLDYYSWVIMAGDPRMSLVKCDKATLFRPNFNSLTFISKTKNRLNCSFTCIRRLFFAKITHLFVNIYCLIELFHHLSRLLTPLHLLSMISLPFGSFSILTLPIQILLQLL